MVNAGSLLSAAAQVRFQPVAPADVPVTKMTPGRALCLRPDLGWLLRLPVLWSLGWLSADQVAAAEDPELGWEGSGELGFVASSGNTKTQTLSTGLLLGLIDEEWRWESELSWLRSTSPNSATGDDTETANRFQGSLQSNMELDERHYLYGSARYERDRYSAFAWQHAYTVGAGVRLLDSDEHRLTLEAGAGHRQSRETVTGEKATDLIGRVRGTHDLHLNDRVLWNSQLLSEYGEENTFSEFQTGLTMDVNSIMAVKIAWTYRSNSETPVGREPIDRLLTVNLVVAFP